METAHAAELSSPRYIVIHHTAVAGKDEQLTTVNNSHCRKWNNPSPFTGYCVEYHYFIGRDGTVVQTREDSERTGHTKNEEINADSVSIVLAGNFQIEDPSFDQLGSLRSVVTKLQKKYGIPKDHVIPHHDASATACPGTRLMEMLWKK